MGASSYLYLSAAARFPQPPSLHLGLAKPVCENIGMGLQQKSASDSFNEIASVRIELRHTDPLIWREVEVPTSITLLVLHDIVQAVVGWFDYHLWELTSTDDDTVWRWTRTGAARLVGLQATCGCVMS
jgi:hypothetical protein